jgi:hypothetical protein
VRARRLTKFQKGEKMRLVLSFFLASAGFAKEKRKKWLAVTKKNPISQWHCDLYQ